MVMLVDERRGTVGILRLIGLDPAADPAPGLRRRRVDRAGRRASFGVLFALADAGRLQPLLPVALRHGAGLPARHARGRLAQSLAMAVPLGIAGQRRRLVDAAAPQRAAPGPPLSECCARLSPGVAWRAVRQPARSAARRFSASPRSARCCSTCCCCRAGWCCRSAICSIAGFDVRVLATDAPPFTGPAPDRRDRAGQALAALPGVDAVLQLRLRSGGRCADRPRATPGPTADGSGRTERRRSAVHRRRSARARRCGRSLRGHDLPRHRGASPTVVVNRNLAQAAGPRVPAAHVALRCRWRGRRSRCRR